MKDNQKDPPLTYALNALGKMVCIDSVKRGLACHCYCPKCNALLEAKLGYGGHIAHFAHSKESVCHGAYMSALHKLAEQIIEEDKVVMAPAYMSFDKRKLIFSEVEVEKRNDRKDLQPDVVGITEDSLRWMIEIRNTNEIDEAKKAKIIESNFTCLEIDVREQTLENLKTFILESAENREWINNPNYDTQIVEAKHKRVLKVEKYLLSCTEFTIPAYVDYASRKISINEVFVLPKTADQLFSQVKVVSSDGTPFVFNIGSRDILDINSHREHETKCNELNIYVDSISAESIIIPKELDISWIYNLKYEQEIREKLESYRINPDYDIRHIEYCKSECEYTPHWNQCIYLEKRYVYEGKMYIICNKKKKDDDKREPIKNAFAPSYNTTTYYGRTTHERYMPNRVVKEKITSITVSKDDERRIDDYYSFLLRCIGSFFSNKMSEEIEILSCDRAKKCCGIIVLFRKNGTYYYLYGISIVNHKLVFIEINDYMSKYYGEKYFKYFVANWKYSIDDADLDNANPFEFNEDTISIVF
jgi:hypothetical protein